MSAPPVPTKTALGQEAMRKRTAEITQRHRTVLFLVDGRRPLSEVLSLAHQAGAATSHFEDLVRMGYVELPPEAPPAPPPAEAPLEATPPAEITELAVDVAAGVAAEPEAAPAVPPPPAVPQAAPLAMPPAAPPAAPPAIDELPRRPFLPPGRVVPPPPPPPPPPVVVLAEDQPVLEQARAQLLECLRSDPQPNGGRLVERVRAAKGTAELIEVVWSMERGLHHHQRTHRGLIALQRARELLGLGNTLVDEDRTPGRRAADDW
jgi:hypothetical protein